MRLLIAHNFYQQAGGEDAVFAAETDLLQSRGHEVVQYSRSNDELRRTGPIRRGLTLLQAPWSLRSNRELTAILRAHKPDAALFINAFPLLSPSAYEACRAQGVPVIQAVGNYRLVCPAALLYRDGAVCEDCLGKHFPWDSVARGCYRGSRLASAGAAALFAWNRHLEAAGRLADVWMVPTTFLERKLVQGGIARQRIVVRPNYLPSDLGPGTTSRDYALFVGRLTRDKGVMTLIEAWSRCAEIPLLIAGSGPEETAARARISSAGLDNVKLLGWQTQEQVASLLRGARFLVLPSEWYEGLPITLLQAFSAATPVVASRIGGLEEVVGDDGVLFEPGSPGSLADAVRRLWQDPALCLAFGESARRSYEQSFSPEPAYRSLMNIFESAIRRSRNASRANAASPESSR